MHQRVEVPTYSDPGHRELQIAAAQSVYIRPRGVNRAEKSTTKAYDVAATLLPAISSEWEDFFL